MNTTGLVERGAELVKECREVFAGERPEAVAAALADLLAIYLASHPDFMRDPLLRQHIRVVRRLIEPNEKIAFGDKGHPMNTRGTG